jgi:hypothetical protein
MRVSPILSFYITSNQMQFNLPSNLQVEVMSYDKTLKRLQPKTTTTKKSKYPNGNPSNLIPTHIVNDRTWQEAVDYINSTSVANGKVRLITRPVFGEEPKPVAVIYFWKQLWVAAWLPQKEEDTYYYGLSYTYKDTATGRKACSTDMLQSSKADDNDQYKRREMQHIKDGKSYWYRDTLLVNDVAIQDGYSSSYWKGINRNSHYISSWGNGRVIWKTITEWESYLLSKIPTYKGGFSRSVFERLADKDAGLSNLLTHSHTRPKWLNIIQSSYVHDINDVLQKIAGHYKQPWLTDVWESKWFRRMVATAMDKLQTIYDTENAKKEFDLDLLVQPYSELQVFIESVCHIKCIWRDMDINYLHSRYDYLSRIEMHGYHSDTGYEWLRANLPVESFLNMLSKQYDKAIETSKEHKSRQRVDSRTGNVHMYTYEWRDTYSMLTQCIAASTDPAKLKPRRWRMTEWHDHLMAETWKLDNPLTSLPQKLFPEPIKVPLKGAITLAEPEVVNTYTFLQPLDTHMLAHWGRAVRNCVGSQSYADGIKKYRHMIVLVMIDNKPRYTVQLTVDKGVMHVSQIADVGNARLNDIDRAIVEDQLKKALYIREVQLQS